MCNITYAAISITNDDYKSLHITTTITQNKGISIPDREHFPGFRKIANSFCEKRKKTFLKEKK